ncbi:MAG: hypothetical protein FD134_1987 [Gallionellaceae bacterium]|nr:MAG: hypothetical protein FD134_1987 [Gallionellaceae bacterium]
MNKTPTWHDPIVAEIHATRERLASQFQDDLAAYSKSAEAHCRALGFQVAENLSSHHNADEASAPVVHA